MTPKYWFPRKPPERGWGWGLPITWQGWLVFGGYFVLLIAASVWLLPDRALSYLGLVLALSALLVFICAKKGEPPGPIGGQK